MSMTKAELVDHVAAISCSRDLLHPSRPGRNDRADSDSCGRSGRCGETGVLRTCLGAMPLNRFGAEATVEARRSLYCYKQVTSARSLAARQTTSQDAEIVSNGDLRP